MKQSKRIKKTLVFLMIGVTGLSLLLIFSSRKSDANKDPIDIKEFPYDNNYDEKSGTEVVQKKKSWMKTYLLLSLPHYCRNPLLRNCWTMAIL